MKSELIKKGIMISGVMLIGVGICALTWFFLREQTVWTHHLFSPNDIDSPDNQTTVRPFPDTLSDDEKPLTRKDRVVQRAKSALMSRLSAVQRANPSMQKMLEIMDSPEFLDLLEKDLTERQWNDFMESQGVEVIREYPGLFRKVVPEIGLADYEQQVSLKFAELFVAAEPVDLTDPIAAADQRSSVFLELGKELTQIDMAALAWFIERFGEDRDGAFQWDAVNNPAFVWMTNIQQNAASIVQAAEQTQRDVLNASTPSWDMSVVMESPSVSSDATTGESPSISPPATDALDRSAIPKPETDAAATPAPGLTGAPQTPTNLPTVEGLEVSLKEQFSSERFDRAMSTLERYGPEEGLRRLRESDPEIAKQVEKARDHNRQEVSQ